MARKVDYEYGGYRLGWSGDQAVAYHEDDAGKTRRSRLNVTRAQGVEAARAALKRFADAVEQQKRAGSPVLLSEIATGYEEYLNENHKRADSWVGNWKALAPFFANLTPFDCDDKTVMRYAKERHAGGVSVGTVWTELSRLGCAVTWAAKTGKIENWGSRRIWRPKQPKCRDRVATVEEIQALLANCIAPHVRVFILLAVLTGARHRAILELTWDRVNFETGMIDFNDGTDAPVDITDRSHKKGRAVVKMSDMLKAELSNWRPFVKCPYVITDGRGKLTTMKKGWGAVCRRAGIDDLRIHDLRHTLATWLNDEGVPMAVISDQLGHKETRTTEKVYVKQTGASTATAAEVVNQKFGKLRVVG